MLLETEATLSESGEKQLIAGIAKKHEASFDRFVRLYQKRLRAFAHSFKQELNEHPDDIAQDILLQIYLSAATFRGDSKVSTWVFSIARNTIRNRMRKKKLLYFWKPASEQDDFNQPPAFGESEEPGADNNMIRLERQKLIQYALQAIPNKNREALALFEFSGLGYDEIAKVLDVSIGTVKSRIYNAKQQLSKIVKSKVTSNDQI